MATTTMEDALEHYSGGRLHDTERACRDILTQQPLHAPALHLLAVLAYRTGHADDAIALVRRAIAVSPTTAEYHSNLGVFLSQRKLTAEAVTACRRAVELAPALAATHYNLGNALRDSGELAGAADAYRQAVTLRFDYAEAHNNLGNVHRGLGELEQAAAAYRQALLLRPEFAHACSSLGDTLKDLGLLEEAMEMHRRAVELSPSSPEIGSNLIETFQYEPDADDAAVELECSQWNTRHAQPLAVFMQRPLVDRKPERPLRVAYLCGNPRGDAVASFAAPLLGMHGVEDMHVTCYASDPVWRSVAEEGVHDFRDRWVDIANLSDADATELIRNDRIDILVDLDGHGPNNRLLTLGRKPAPVQLSYLGASACSGIDATEFRLTDPYLDPFGAARFGIGTPLQVSESAWCFRAPTHSAAIDSLPALRNGHVRFGSFVETLAQLSPETLRMWSRILQQVPGSRLVIQNRALDSAQAARVLQRRFAALGIDAARIDLVLRRPTPAQRFDDTLASVDIALDPFPVHGMAATCRALWMGVPVFTLEGHRHASRTGVSLLSNAGHPELIVPSPDAYVQQAVALATDLPRLSELRAVLRDDLRRSKLMDEAGFTHALAALYRRLWREWCARPLP